MADHPVFEDIGHGDLEAVQQRVLADPAVLEELAGDTQFTPLMYAIGQGKNAMALWIIEHRGQLDLDARDSEGQTAAHYASKVAPLPLPFMQALVAAG